MNKEEQIQEIAKEICHYVESRDTDKVYVLATPDPSEELLEYTHNAGIAEALYDKDYRKIEKGEVVLSAEENSDYIMLKQNYDFVKGENTRLQADNERLYKNLAKFEEVVRKKTAKEILNEIASPFYSNGENYELTLHDIQELAEEYGVEVEE